jgi:hypothetical protein
MAALPRRTAKPKTKPAQKREPRKFIASPDKDKEKTAA